MTSISRRSALGTTVGLCHLPAASAAMAPAEPVQDPQTRKAIETYANAWEKGDMPTLMNCYHPEFTLNYFGKNALAGRHVGKAAALKVLGTMRQRTDRKLIAVNALLVGGDKAVMLTRESLSAKGQIVEVERVYVYTVMGVQLLECWVYDRDQRQLDALIGA